MSMQTQVNDDRPQWDPYTRWWHRLNNSERCRQEQWQPLPTSHRAMLRRCSNLEQVMLTEAFQQLWLSLPENHRHAGNIELAALIAWTFSAVDKNHSASLAKAMAQRADEGAERPRVSQLRFQQLLAARDVEDFARRLRRVIKQLKGEVDLLSLSREIQNWYWQNISGRQAQRPSDRQVLKWAMDYYESLPQ